MLKQIVIFSCLGLGSGALIAALALGVVLTYRGAGVINLAVGAIATFGAFTFYGLRTNGELFLPPIGLGQAWATGPALVAAIAMCALLGVALDAVVFRQLRRSAPLARLLATLGLLLALQAAFLIRYGGEGVTAPAVLSASPTVPVFGVNVPREQFILAGIVLLVAMALSIAYRRSWFGMATRAAQEDESMAMLSGLSPNALSMCNTVLSSVIAGAIGVLVAPTTQLDPVLISLLIVPALAASLVARFTSFGIAAAVGIGMGIVQSLTVWVVSTSWFPKPGGQAVTGLSDLVFFVIILGLTFWRADAIPGRGFVQEKRLPRAPVAKAVGWPIICWGVLAAAAIVVLPPEYRQAAINSLIGAMLCLAFVVVTGYVGQVSLLQLALAGVSALIVSKLAVHAGIGFPIAPMIGTAAAVLFGLMTAIPALRVRGVQLAIVTMAGAVAVENFWFQNISIGMDPTGSVVPHPSLLGLNLGTSAPFFVSGVPSPMFGFLCLVILAACAYLVIAVRRSVLGKRMLAVRSNERAAAAAGVDVVRTKLIAYGISATIAGLAGALSAYSFGSVSSDDYSLTLVLALLAYAYVGGITTVTGALFGGLFVAQGILAVVLTQVIGISSNYQFALGGLLLIVNVIRFPEGIAGFVLPLGGRVRQRALDWARPVAPAASEPVVGEPASGVKP